MDLSTEFLIPYQTLQVGHEVYFTLFDDAPPFTLTSGVVCSIDVQVGKLMDGSTSVQTLIGLVPLLAWLDSPTQPQAQELVPLEFMNEVSVEGYHPRFATSPVKEELIEEREVDVAESAIVTLDDVYSLYERKRPEKKAPKKKKSAESRKKDEVQKVTPISLGISRRR